MTDLGARLFRFGDESQFALLLHQSVVGGDGNGLATAHVVTTGISHMGDHGLVVAKGA